MVRVGSFMYVSVKCTKCDAKEYFSHYDSVDWTSVDKVLASTDTAAKETTAGYLDPTWVSQSTFDRYRSFFFIRFYTLLSTRIQLPVCPPGQNGPHSFVACYHFL